MESMDFYVVSRSCKLRTNDVVSQTDLLKWGYSVGESRTHGDCGLYLGGNHLGYMFFTREGMSEFVHSFAPEAEVLSSATLAWWKV